MADLFSLSRYQPMNALFLDRRVRPGQRVPDSGIYVTESGQRATLVYWEPAPPTRFAGETWTQVFDTILNDGHRPVRNALGQLGSPPLHSPRT